jgi:hypothetical protein
MAVNHWIEHQTRLEHQEIRAHRTPLAGQCRSAPDNRSSPPPTLPDELHRPSTRSNHPTVCTDTKIEVTPSW